MNTLFAGKNFIELPSVGSTNDYCMELLASNPAEGTVVLAHAQTNGKGQMDNSWFSDPGMNLTFSIVLYPRFIEAERVFMLNKLMSYSIMKTFAHFLNASEAMIKWPNDVLINKKKAAGILIRNHFERNSIKNSIIGVGVNVNQRDFPDEFSARTTSMSIAGNTTFDLMQVLETILQNLEAEYLRLKHGNVAPLDFNYLQNLFGYQEIMSVKIDEEEKDLVLVGVDKSGRAAFEFDGGLKYFNEKEVSFCL